MIWYGENIPVPLLIAKKADKLRAEINDEVLEEQKKFFLHTNENIFFETNKEYLIIHSSFGTKINKSLYTALTALLSSKYGISLSFKSNAYGAVIRVPDMDFDAVKLSLSNMHEEWLNDILSMSLKTNSSFNWTFANVAKRCGILKKNAEINKRLIKMLIEIYQTP